MRKRAVRQPFADMAERVGFEPTEPRGSTVFKTAAFDHSATSPGKIELLSRHVQTTQRVHVESGEPPRYENHPGFHLRVATKASSVLAVLICSGQISRPLSHLSR